MASSYLERKREMLQKMTNHHMSQAGNGMDIIIKTRRKMSNMGQMTTPKLQKGKKLLKHQLRTITTQDKTSWMEISMMMTRFNEQD